MRKGTFTIIALAMLALCFVFRAEAVIVILQDTDGNPLPSDAEWRVSGYDTWHESGGSEDVGSTSADFTFYFQGKNVIWPDSLTTNLSIPASTTLTLQYPLYSNAISIVLSGAPTDSDVTWTITAYPDLFTNTTSYKAQYTNSHAIYNPSTNLLSYLPEGDYKIVGGVYPGYYTPASVITNIDGDPLTNAVTLNYVAYSNSIAVTVYGFPTGNCVWTITGPPEFTNSTGYMAGYTNNATIASVPTGSYVFNFPGVLGYTTPTNTLTITGDPLTNAVTATYVLAYPTNIPSGSGIQKFYQPSYFFTNVYLHDSGIPLHTRIAGYLTNVTWGSITGTLANQTDLQAALDGKASIGDVASISNAVDVLETNTAPLQSYLSTSNTVAVIETNYFPLPSGIGVSNRLDIIETNYFPLQSGIGVSNRVNIIETNYAQLPDFINVSGRVDTLEGQTNNYTLTNDTRQLAWTGADIRIADSVYSNSPVTRNELFNAIDSASVLTLFGDTNAHDTLSGSRLTRETPTAWAITNELTDGTNIVGTFWLTNSTDRIRAGNYIGRFYSSKTGTKTARGQIELLYSDDDGATTNVVDTSALSTEIGSGIASSLLTVNNDNDITNSALWLGVRYSIVQSGGGADCDVITYGGNPYDTHLATPGIGTITGYVTDDELTAVDVRVGAIESNYVVSVNTLTGAVELIGRTNINVTTNGNQLIFDAEGSGTITNLLSTDGSVAISDPGGPQPDLSVSGYCNQFVPTNFITDSNTSATVAIGVNTNSPVQLDYQHYDLPMPDLGIRFGQFYKGPFAGSNPNGPIIRFSNTRDSGAYVAPEYCIAYFDDAGDLLNGGGGLYFCRRNDSTYYLGVLSIQQDRVRLGYYADFDANGRVITNASTIYATNGAFEGTLTLGGNTVLTNAVTEYGTGDSTVYRGDWGASVSNTASAALSTNGGTMGGDINMSGNDITNAGTVTVTNINLAGGTLNGGGGMITNLNYSAWRFSVGSDSNLPATTECVIPFNTTIISNNVGKGNYYAVPKVNGSYLVGAALYVKGNMVDKPYILRLRRNGDDYETKYGTLLNSAGGDNTLTIQTLMALNGAQTVDVTIIHYNDSTITNDNRSTATFWGYRVGD